MTLLTPADQSKTLRVGKSVGMGLDLGMGMHIGLGLDAGGTETRWAIADDRGDVIEHGTVQPLSALLLLSDEGRKELHLRLAELATLVGHAVACCRSAGETNQPRLVGILGSFTGLAQQSTELNHMVAAAFSLSHSLSMVSVLADIELTHRLHFDQAPGCVIYAGTGSYASALDSENLLQRVGGRGGLLDDAGSGYWIAKEALRLIWRREDERPGQWRQSALAQSVFARMGANDWAGTRAFVYSESNAKSRGKLAMLALAVADAATEGDEVALGILQAAGAELARLGNIVLQRFGDQPIVLAGRVIQLHPEVKRALHAGLPSGTEAFETQIIVPQAAAKKAAQFSFDRQP